MRYSDGKKCFFCRSAPNKNMPVIFLPNDSKNEAEEDCGDSNGTQMSSFGFMSFAMALVNTVINNANNVNNNNNNNNNNDNNNNNNLGNINIANSNNDVNNMNMATAGRRRRLYRNVSNDQDDASVLKSTRKTSALIEIMTNPQQNLSLTQAYGTLKSGQKWKTNLINPVHTISIGYIKNKHTKPRNVTNGKQLEMVYPSQKGYAVKLKTIHNHIFQNAKYITSIIINYIAKIPFKTYFPTFSLTTLWSSITSSIGK